MRIINYKLSLFKLFLALLTLSSNVAFSANRYWVAAANTNWNSTANWSTTSGSGSGASVPGVNDLAIFDGASGSNGNCSIDATVNVAGIQINGYSGTISQNAFSATVGASNYTQNSGAFAGSASAFTINTTGVFSLSGGTFTATSGNFTISGSRGSSQTVFSHSAGTFNHNNGNIILNPNQPGCSQLTYTIDVLGSTAFYNLELNATPSCGINAIITTGANPAKVANNLTHTDGYLTGTYTFSNNLVVGTLADGGTGTITANGTGTQTYTFTTGGARTCQLIVNKASGSLAPAVGTADLSVQSFALQAGTFTAPTGNFNIGGTWVTSQTLFNQSGGTFNHNSGTVIINPNQPGCTQLTFTMDVIPTTVLFNLIINATPSCGLNAIVTTAAGDVVYASGNFTHTDGVINGLFQFYNNLIIGANSDGGSGTLTAVGFGFQEYTYAAGAARTCKLVIDKPAGVISPATGTTDLSCQSFTLKQGRFISPSGNFNIGGTWNSSQTLFNHSGGSFDHNTGTVIINPIQPGCAQLAFTMDVLPSTDFYNLQLNATPSCGLNPIVTTAGSDVVNVVNDLTHTDGILNGQFTLKKNLIIANTSDGGTGLITVNGNTNQTYSFTTGGARTCKIAVNKGFGTFAPASGTTDFSIQALAIQAGSFTAPTGNLNIGGTWTVSTIIFQQTGGTFLHNSGLVTLNPIQPGCAQLTFTADVAVNTVFYNLTINATPSCGLSAILAGGAGDTIDVVNNLIYTDGICNVMLEAGGNVTVGSAFDGGTGRLIFKGSSAQNFDLTGATDLFDAPIVVNKTGNGITLSSVCVLNGTGQSIDFIGGKINTTSSNLLKVDDAVNVLGGSTTSHVNGPMVRIIGFNGVSSNVFFPIGALGQYRQIYLNVTHNVATDFEYTGEVKTASAQSLGLTLAAGTDKVSPVRYWQIDRSSAGNITAASVKAHYGNDDGVTDNTNLRLVKGSGAAWTDLGGTGTANGSGSITSSINFTTFSPFALANVTGGLNFPGSALNFVGGNDYVSVPAGGGLNNLQSGTIEMWVKWSGTQDQGYGNQWGAVLARQSDGVFTNQLIALDGSNPATAKIIWNPYTFNTTAITSAAAPGDGVWNHIAITYQSGAHKMYVNGVLVGSSSLTGTINNNNAKVLTIGGWIDDGQGFSTSNIDEVRIWNRVLCQGEIQNNMNCEIATTGNGLLSNYHFNQGIAEGSNGAITSLTDASGNSNTGTLNNFALSGSTSNWVGDPAVISGISCGVYGPEINVKGNAVSILDGDITPASADHSDFGSVGLNTPFARTYTIENLGVSALTISSASVSGGNAAMFAVGSIAPSGPIAPSASATITVTFTPTSTGIKTTTLNILSDDCDEAMYDFTIQGNGATAGAALNMDGVDDYIDLGNPAVYNFTKTTPFSLETWVKFTSGATQDQQIVCKQGSTNPAGWGLQCTNGAGRDGKIEFYLLGNYSNASQNMWLRSNFPTDIRDNTWHHIAATYDGSNTSAGLHIFIDGVDYGGNQLQNTTIASGDITNSYTARIGGYWTYGGGPAEYLFGEIDETRIWAKELCVSEISTRRNCEISTNYNKLVLNYHYNQGLASGSNPTVVTATDASASVINGTLTNFALTGATSNWISPGAVTSGVSCANQCDSNSTVATAVGTFTSNMSYTSPVSGFTHYCDCQGKLLLSLKLGGTGAVIPENGISLKINSTGAIFYPQSTGFVGNTFGYAAMNRTWNVAPTTQPISKVSVRYYFNSTDVTNVSNTLVANSLPGIFGPDDMTFWKVTNIAKPAHAAVATLAQADVKILAYNSVPTDSTWVLGNPSLNNYYAQFLVSGFSGGGGGAGPLGLTPLPVELLYLAAEGVHNKFIQVKWATASETNSGYFDVQRSENGREFVTIGRVNAAGNSTTERRYSYNDLGVVANKNYYYRLVIVDLESHKEASKTVVAKLSIYVPSAITFYPNPSQTQLNIAWPNEADQADLMIYTAEGKLVLQKSMDTKTQSSIDVSAVSNGIYFVKVTMNGTQVNSRIIIQH